MHPEKGEFLGLPVGETLARLTNGRYLAALSADSTKLMLYDLEKKGWSQLAQSLFAFENWSHDGKYLYAEDYPDKTDDFVRVGLDGKIERLFSLKEIPRGFDPT